MSGQLKLWTPQRRTIRNRQQGAPDPHQGRVDGLFVIRGKGDDTQTAETPK